jgi:hypothetical protein
MCLATAGVYSMGTEDLGLSASLTGPSVLSLHEGDQRARNILKNVVFGLFQQNLPERDIPENSGRAPSDPSRSGIGAAIRGVA